ncbi:MAG TPA: exodeoxyribonuclease III [Chitinophagaceae bacterium]|nr:exodeoxyribonuclease III [Chitinophagaceae bacterium]
MGTLRIISYNVNGLRAAISKGFMDWLASSSADIVCLQEIKAARENVDAALFSKLGYEQYWFPSSLKKGYSGVAVFTKVKPDKVEYGHRHTTSDGEGRVIQLNFGDFRLINAYFPSGTSGDERQQFKYSWLKDFQGYLDKLRKTYPRLILCGDYNIAHKEIDIHDPKGNKYSSGFLPDERAWMDQFFSGGWMDTFRQFHPEPQRYTWWSQRFPSVRLQNKGWRIDYINTTENLKNRLLSAEIMPDVKHSDHCPVQLDLQV